MDRPIWVTNEQEWLANCREIVRRARDLIEGRANVIESARALFGLSFRVRAERDPDFQRFAGIDSESDALPVGPERDNWSRSALEREDAKIVAFQERWRDQAVESAKRLIEKYAEFQSGTE
jgi:hypothetical protein